MTLLDMLQRRRRVMPETQAWLSLGGIYFGALGFAMSPTTGWVALAAVAAGALPINRAARRAAIAEVRRTEREREVPR